MKTIRKPAALCAAVLLSICLFSTTAYAVEEPAAPAPAATAEPAPAPVTESAIPEGGEAGAVAQEQPETAPPEAADDPAVPEAETESAVNITPPDGTGTVIETATSEDGREFYTISTPAGNVFYLVIDFSRQSENVYFLDAVTEKDLIALAEQSDDTAFGEEKTESAIPDEQTEESAGQEDAPEAQDEAEAGEKSGMTSLIILIAVLAVGGGVAVYFKVYRKRKNADVREEYETDEPYESDGDDYMIDDEDEYIADREDGEE